MASPHASLPLVSTLLLCLAGTALQAQSRLAASLEARLGYDSNVFLQDDAPLAAGQTVAGLAANAGAWVGYAGLKLAASASDGSQRSEFSYAPSLWRYDGCASENHTDHVFSIAGADRLGDTDCDLQVSYTLVDGSKETPLYNRLGGNSATGGVMVRNRRAQNILRGSFTALEKRGSAFFRGLVSGHDQDFRTYETATPFKANYSDRSEILGGLDFGLTDASSRRYFLGARAGYQRQANQLGVSLNDSNTFVRTVAGAEGVFGSVKLKAQVGPDFRSFGRSLRAGVERRRTDLFADVTAAWTLGKRDAINAQWKRALGLAGSGRAAYVDSLYELSWKHSFSPAQSLSLVANANQGDFLNLAQGPRRDWIYNLGARYSIAVGKKTSFELATLRDWSETRIPNTPSRAYHRWYNSVAVSLSL
jgi:hypothetical protein